MFVGDLADDLSKIGSIADINLTVVEFCSKGLGRALADDFEVRRWFRETVEAVDFAGSA